MSQRPKDITVSIEDLSDGLNTTDPASDVGKRFLSSTGKKQVQDALDFMFHSKSQRPGSDGSSGVFSTYCRGLGTYLRHNGDEYLLSVSNGILYSHLTSSPFTKTQLFNMGGDGEAWFADCLDMCVVCNGTNVVKVEGAVAYQVSLDAPTGASAAAQTGGTLPDGDYMVYAGYARRVDGSNVLYGVGQSLGTVTLGTGNNTVRVTFPNSSDSQVNNKVVWMTDASGTVYYFYHQTLDNTTTTVDVTSNSARDTTLLYSVEAQRNYECPAFEYVIFHNGYLYGSIGATVYRSLRAGTRYDLERFDTRATGNTADFPFQIVGMFGIGQDLYLNTPAGIIKVPDGDIFAEYSHVEKLNWFKYPRTVAAWNGGLIGLTAQNVGWFDGEKIWPHDLAQDIKPEIQKVYDGYSSNHRPCGAVYRRGDRTEYHLSYKDNSVSTTHHNRRLVLNLDKVSFLQETRVRAPWEVWSNGAAYMVVSNSGVWYCVQSLQEDGCIYREHTYSNRDKNIYRDGSLETDAEYGWMLKTGILIHSLRGIIRWYQARLYATWSDPITLTVDASLWPETITDSVDFKVSGAGVSRYDTARFGTARFAAEDPVFKPKPLSRALKGIGVVITLEADGEDKSLALHKAEVYGTLTVSRFT